MAVMEDELQRLWQLLAELSAQLTQNREQCEHLKRQADDLKTQAIHTGTGYALKRFNVDLSKEQFESEVERMNAQLVIENQTLQHENRQLTILLKDHETTLEQIMTRFRNHAHSTQQHELELTKYYESLLLSLMEKQQQQQRSSSPVHNHSIDDGRHPSELDPNTFLVIQNISILIQKAMRELSGEEPYLNEIDELESQQAELGSRFQEQINPPEDLHPSQPSNNGASVTFQDPFKSSTTSSTDSATSSAGTDEAQRRKSTSVIDFRPRVRDPSRGGYVGKRNGSLSDHALLSAIESERLRKENEYLREMLGIATDFTIPSHPVISSLDATSSNPGNNSQLPTVSEQAESDSIRTKFKHVVPEVIEEEDEEGREEPEQLDHRNPIPELFHADSDDGPNQGGNRTD